MLDRAKSNCQRNIVSKGICYTFLVFIFLTPLLKGLYIREAFYFSLVFSLGLLLVCFIFLNISLSKEIIILLSMQFSLNTISLFTSVNKEEALYGFFLMCFPFIMFILASNVLETFQRNSLETFINTLLWVLFTSSVIISFINFIFRNINGHNNNSYRFGEVIQYANTLALFLFIGTIIGCYFLSQASISGRLKMYAAIGTFLNLSAFIFTYSRLMWVLAVFLFVIYIAFVKCNELSAFFIIIAFLAIGNSVISSLTNWRFIWFSLVLSTLFIIIYIRNYKRFNFNIKQPWRVFIILAVLAVALTIFIPNSLITRIQSINLNATEFQERLAYYRDSMSILKDYPVLGIGQGGWDSIQYKYQSAIYSVKYVHSSFIQSLINYGLLGLILFMLQIGFFLKYAIKAFRQKQRNSSLLLCLIVINTAIILHSAVDIDFEFPIVILVFWMVNSILYKLSDSRSDMIVSGRAKKIIACTATMLAAIISMPMMISSSYFDKGLSFFDSKDYKDAWECFQKAAKILPVSSNSYYMQGQSQLELYNINHLDTHKNQSILSLGLAQKYNKYQPLYASAKARLYRLSGDYENCVQAYDELITLQPLLVDNYEGMANALVRLAENEDKKGNKDASKKNYLKVTRIKSELDSLQFRLSPDAAKLKHKMNYDISPQLALDLGTAFYHLNDRANGDHYMQIASKGRGE